MNELKNKLIDKKQKMSCEEFCLFCYNNPNEFSSYINDLINDDFLNDKDTNTKYLVKNLKFLDYESLKQTLNAVSNETIDSIIIYSLLNSQDNDLLGDIFTCFSSNKTSQRFAEISNKIFKNPLISSNLKNEEFLYKLCFISNIKLPDEMFEEKSFVDFISQISDVKTYQALVKNLEKQNTFNITQLRKYRVKYYEKLIANHEKLTAGKLREIIADLFLYDRPKNIILNTKIITNLAKLEPDFRNKLTNLEFQAFDSICKGLKSNNKLVLLNLLKFLKTNKINYAEKLYETLEEAKNYSAKDISEKSKLSNLKNNISVKATNKLGVKVFNLQGDNFMFMGHVTRLNFYNLLNIQPEIAAAKMQNFIKEFNEKVKNAPKTEITRNDVLSFTMFSNNDMQGFRIDTNDSIILGYEINPELVRRIYSFDSLSKLQLCEAFNINAPDYLPAKLLSKCVKKDSINEIIYSPNSKPDFIACFCPENVKIAAAFAKMWGINNVLVVDKNKYLSANKKEAKEKVMVKTFFKDGNGEIKSEKIEIGRSNTMANMYEPIILKNKK